MSLILLLISCGSADAEVDAREALALPSVPGVRVEVAELRPSPAIATLSFPAMVTSPGDATVSAPRGGPVEAVLVDVGDRVRKGQVLVRVDAAALNQQFIIAEAQARQANLELERMKALGDAISPSQLLAAETQATIANANEQLARLSLGRAVVVSPVSGEVAWVGVHAGENAGPGAPLVRVVSTDPLELQLSVSDRDLPLLDPGAEVYFRSQAYPVAAPGILTHVAPAADPKTRTFEATVSMPNPEGHLKPGMLGRVGVMKTLEDSALVIPQDWVVTRLDSTGVYIEQDGAAAWRTITLGAYLEDQVVVSGGLEAGDRIVSKGARDLTDGDPLIVVRSGVCCTAGRVDWE